MGPVPLLESCPVDSVVIDVYNTVEPVLKDHPIGCKNVVCHDRWSLVTGSVMLKCKSFCQKCVVFQDRWSLMAVVSQDRFHCSMLSLTHPQTNHSPVRESQQPLSPRQALRLRWERRPVHTERVLTYWARWTVTWPSHWRHSSTKSEAYRDNWRTFRH